MTREDAFFQMLLIRSGITEEYDAWFDRYLEEEDPLSDIVLALVDAGSDFNKILSCLYFYTAERPIDYAKVTEMLRLYLKNAYESGRFDKITCTSYMYRFAEKSGRMHEEFAPMMIISDYLSYADDGLCDKEKWEKILFLPYLSEGKIGDHHTLWNAPRLSFRKRVKRFFGK